MSTKILPKWIYLNNIVLLKVSYKSNDNIFYELLNLFKKNKAHLFYWHHEDKHLLFSNIEDIKKRLRRWNIICYVIYNSNKIIGCIETHKDEKILNCCLLTFWIGKKNVRKGIMLNCLIALEEIFIARNYNFLKAQVDVENIPSIKLMKKLNFKKIYTDYLTSATKNGYTMCKYHTFEKELIKR